MLALENFFVDRQTRPSLQIDSDERAARLNRLAEEFPENLFPVAVAVRVLLPDERVGGDDEEATTKRSCKSSVRERPEVEQLRLLGGLKIECHARYLHRVMAAR